MTPRRRPAASTHAPRIPAAAPDPAPSAGMRRPAALLAEAATQFRVLGEPVRLRLLELLCQGPQSVMELAAHAEESHANTSKHLGVLAAAGFVTRTTEGTRAIYTLADESTLALCDVMCDRVVRRAEASLKAVRRAK